MALIQKHKCLLHVCLGWKEISSICFVTWTWHSTLLIQEWCLAVPLLYHMLSDNSWVCGDGVCHFLYCCICHSIPQVGDMVLCSAPIYSQQWAQLTHACSTLDWIHPQDSSSVWHLNVISTFSFICYHLNVITLCQSIIMKSLIR